MASTPATEFPRFLNLPFEIRWAVYELCLPTRVVDSAINPERIIFGTHGFTDVHAPAYRHIVSKFSNMPVICKAIPEVYREIRRHLIAPPANEWAWTWNNGNFPGKFTDPRPILFDPRSDVVYISPCGWSVGDDDPQQIHRSPVWLARSQETVVALDEWTIGRIECWPALANYCFLGRENCTIILSETRLVKPMESIISCGLFGLFGEERTVLVDVDDLERIDYFDTKLNNQDIQPHLSHGNVNFQRAWDKDSPVVSAEERAETIALDKKTMLRRVKAAWLEANHLFRASGQADPDLSDPSLVPFEGWTSWDMVFDEEHPNAKPWLDKLPAFSFAVRVHAIALEEPARLWGAELAWQQKKLVDGPDPWDW
ncbi:hypothetical protein Daus18300_003740 [Diaporthe australafricana]|uniref:2EXR domain-containing protein n=1 Tax=Diaporthe australafricana TaxID=127596 RepID=A0ABR3XE18_9PEZI